MDIKTQMEFLKSNLPKHVFDELKPEIEIIVRLYRMFLGLSLLGNWNTKANGTVRM